MSAPRCTSRITGSCEKIKLPETIRGIDSATKRIPVAAIARRARPPTFGPGGRSRRERLGLGVILVVAAVVVTRVSIIVLRVTLHIDLAQHDAGEIGARLQGDLEPRNGRLPAGPFPADEEHGGIDVPD